MLTLTEVAESGSLPARSLLATLRAERLGQAYLLHGPSGDGKQQLARALVAARFCPERTRRGNACGTCLSCRRVGLGTHPDQHELRPAEGKREILVEQVRELIDALGLAPFEAPGRVAIIDPVEAVRVEGANTLLKTLEEPPDGVMMLLLSSRPDLLLPTIRSQCMELRVALVEAKENAADASEATTWLREATSLLVLPDAGAALDRADRAWRLIERAADEGTGTPTAKRREATLRVLDLVVTQLRTWFRTSVERGCPAVRLESTVLRVLESVAQIDGNAVPRLVVEVLALDLDAAARARERERRAG